MNSAKPSAESDNSKTMLKSCDWPPIHLAVRSSTQKNPPVMITNVDAGFSVKSCCRVLGVSRQGYYRHQRRSTMAATMMRRKWLTALITQVHADSRGTYGSRCVHAGLIVARGVVVSEQLVWRRMHDAGTQGLPDPAKASKKTGVPASDDLGERRFARSRLNELWVSDFTEHPTREGKACC